MAGRPLQCLKAQGTSLEEGWARYLDSSIFQAMGHKEGQFCQLNWSVLFAGPALATHALAWYLFPKVQETTQYKKRVSKETLRVEKKKFAKTSFTRAFRVRTSLFAVAVSRVLLITRKSSMVVSSLFATIFVTSDSLDMLFSII